VLGEIGFRPVGGVEAERRDAVVIDDRDEWIEIVNPARRPVDLSGWTVDAGKAGGRYKLPRRSIIPAGGYLVLYRGQSKLKLADAGGQIRLLDLRGRAVDAVPYPEIGQDASIERSASGDWQPSLVPSPGGPPEVQ